jgi:hypothetical protein
MNKQQPASMDDLKNFWCVSPKINERRCKLLLELNTLKETYPNYCVFKFGDDMTDDQLEIAYLKNIRNIEEMLRVDLEKALKSKNRDDLEKALEEYSPMLMNLYRGK